MHKHNWARISGISLFLLFGVAIIPALRVVFVPGVEGQWSFYLHNAHVTAFEVAYICWSVLSPKGQGLAFDKVPKVVMALVLIWLFVSIAASYQAQVPFDAWIKTGQYFAHLLFGYALYRNLKFDWHVLSILPMAVVVGFLAYSLALLIGLANLNEQHWLQLTWHIPGFNNVRLLGFYTALTGAVMIVMYWTAVASDYALGQRAALWAALIWCWGLLFWSGSRGAVLALAATYGAFFLTVKLGKRLSVFYAVVGAAVIGALGSLAFPVADKSFGIFRFLDKAKTDDLNNFSSSRIEIWKEAIDAWSNSPLIGCGPGQTKYMLPTANGVFAQPHNFVVDAFFSWGVLGGVPFLIFIFYILYRLLTLIRGLSKEKEYEVVLAGSAIALTLALNALIDGALYHPFPSFFFTLAVAMAFAGGVQTQLQPHAKS